MLEDGDLDNVRNSEAFARWFAQVAPPSLVDQFLSGR
jgi:hypothetical protein